MDRESFVQSICAELKPCPYIQGIFLGGSLANDDLDAYSDIDLGVVSGNDEAESEAVFALRGRIVELPGPPVHAIERGWDHCRLIAALYGKSLFPPIGLELDVIFSQLQHIGEQMPYSDYRLLFDRNGLVAEALRSLPRGRPQADVLGELRGYVRSLPFWVHDAQKALRRGDLPQFQTLLDALRQALFSLAAARRDAVVYGSKRGFGFLSPDESAVVAFTYGAYDPSALERLALLLVEAFHKATESITELDPGLEAAVRKMEDILADLL
jgi:predicted nucleotidyltransferase